MLHGTCYHGLPSSLWLFSCGAHVAASHTNLAGIDLCRKTQGAQALWRKLCSGADVDKHECLGITPQAGLQQPGQLAVAEGDVGVLVRQRHNHVTWATGRVVVAVVVGGVQVVQVS